MTFVVIGALRVKNFIEESNQTFSVAVNSGTILFSILRNTLFLEQSDFSRLGFSGVQDLICPDKLVL